MKNKPFASFLAVSSILLLSACSASENTEQEWNSITEQENNITLDSATTLYKEFLQKHPKSSQSHKAMFRLANTLAKNRKLEEAAKMFQDCYRQYPDSTHAADALYSSAFLHEQVDNKIAMDLYKLFIRSYPNDQRTAQTKEYLKYVGKDAEYILEELRKQGKLSE
jgi:TolA-binding protein